MNIVIINGSARKGNTLTAIQAFIEGAGNNHTFTIIEPDKLQIHPCKGCDACQSHKGCIDKDDTNPTIGKIVAADMILFTTPVYWWGITAQLKLVIDKFYCRGAQLRGKKAGLIVIGADTTDALQYELIRQQFNCIAEYLSWDMLFSKSYSANTTTDLYNNKLAIVELNKLGAQVNDNI